MREAREAAEEAKRAAAAQSAEAARMRRQAQEDIAAAQKLAAALARLMQAVAPRGGAAAAAGLQACTMSSFGFKLRTTSKTQIVDCQRLCLSAEEVCLGIPKYRRKLQAHALKT